MIDSSDTSISTEDSAGTSSSNGRRGHETRAALLSAGREVFARRGFDGASVREITQRAEANLGAITYHFGSKRALYESVLEEGLSPMVDRVGEVATSGGTPMKRLRGVAEVIFEFLGAKPELPRLLLQEVSAGKTPPAPVMDIIRRNARHVISILEEGWEDGSIREMDPMLSALSVVAQPIYMTLVSPLFLQISGIDLRDSDARARAIDHVHTVLRSGLGRVEEVT